MGVISFTEILNWTCSIIIRYVTSTPENASALKSTLERAVTTANPVTLASPSAKSASAPNLEAPAMNATHAPESANARTTILVTTATSAPSASTGTPTARSAPATCTDPRDRLVMQ